MWCFVGPSEGARERGRRGGGGGCPPHQVYPLNRSLGRPVRAAAAAMTAPLSQNVAENGFQKKKSRSDGRSLGLPSLAPDQPQNMEPQHRVGGWGGNQVRQPLLIINVSEKVYNYCCDGARSMLVSVA